MGEAQARVQTGGRQKSLNLTSLETQFREQSS